MRDTDRVSIYSILCDFHSAINNRRSGAIAGASDVRRNLFVIVTTHRQTSTITLGLTHVKFTSSSDCFPSNRAITLWPIACTIIIASCCRPSVLIESDHAQIVVFLCTVAVLPLCTFCVFTVLIICNSRIGLSVKCLCIDIVFPKWHQTEFGECWNSTQSLTNLSDNVNFRR